MLVVNWMNGRWKTNNQKFRTEVHKTQNLPDLNAIKPVGDHLDLFQHFYRDWNEKADCLTHKGRMDLRGIHLRSETRLRRSEPTLVEA